MNKIEKEEISRLPEKYRPMGAWGYFGYTILFNIPLIGQILLLVFCFSGSNINRRSFARSYFCGLAIVLIILAIVFVISLVAGADLIGMIKEWIANFMPQG